MPKGRYKTYDWNLLFIAAAGDEERRRKALIRENIAFLKRIGIADIKNYVNDVRLDFRRLEGFLQTFYYSNPANKEQAEETRRRVREYKVEYYKKFNDYVRIGALKDDCFMKSQMKDTVLDKNAGPFVYHVNNDHLSEDGNGAHKVIFDT